MRVLITGGAGSLGREFVKHLSEEEVYVLDNNEWAAAELAHEFPDVNLILGDFADVTLPDIDYVIHCAAYKHVNLGEGNVEGFIDNNLSSTVKFYRKLGPSTKVLYISTDKAVEPISAYGATKMLAEKLTWERGGSVARCGNFLGSSGSVIPVWEKCIREGKSIPITDERMVRYVSNTEEAVKEIWDQFFAGEKLIVPTVRKIRVMDLLMEVLKKHGYMSAEAYEPGVTVIGIRPGEKIEEKLKWDNEL